MKLKCHRCKKEWEYTGEKKAESKYPQYVSCPKCRTSVKVKQTKEGENK